MIDGEGAPAAEAGAALQQILSFVLGDEVHGIPILHVQEIKCAPSVTTLPQAPDYVRGAMNLRGTIVPIVDLRRRFGLPPLAGGSRNVVVVVNVRDRVVGLIVDSVSEVVDVRPEQVVAVPELAGAAGVSLLAGMAKLDDRLIPILALEPVVGLAAEVIGLAA